MNRMRAAALGVMASGVFSCAALVAAQQQKTRPSSPRLARLQATQTSSDSRLIGITAVRIINTAEMKFKNDHGSYASWNKLSSSDAVGSAEKQFGGMVLRSGRQPVTGWELALVVSSSGQSYQLSLRNLPDECEFSFFSDERGIIYQGGAIDCSIDLKPAR